MKKKSYGALILFFSSAGSMACDMLLNPADALDRAYADNQMDIQTRGPLLATACATFSLVTGPLAIVLGPLCLASVVLPTP